MTKPDNEKRFVRISPSGRKWHVNDRARTTDQQVYTVCGIQLAAGGETGPVIENALRGLDGVSSSADRCLQCYLAEQQLFSKGIGCIPEQEVQVAAA